MWIGMKIFSFLYDIFCVPDFQQIPFIHHTIFSYNGSKLVLSVVVFFFFFPLHNDKFLLHVNPLKDGIVDILLMGMVDSCHP